MWLIYRRAFPGIRIALTTPQTRSITEEADMTKIGGLVVLVMLTLGLVTPAGLPGVLVPDGEPPQGPRADRLDSTQRGEDPLQAPRGETR